MNLQDPQTYDNGTTNLFKLLKVCKSSAWIVKRGHNSICNIKIQGSHGN